MKAISTMNPWAWLIVQGIKPIKNRNWTTEYRGPLLIHASKTWDEKGERWIWGKIASRWSLPIRGIPHREDPRYTFGALIGKVDLVDVIVRTRGWRNASPWFVGPYGFVLRNAVEFKDPIYWPGQLGLFEVPDEVVRMAA